MNLDDDTEDEGLKIEEYDFDDDFDPDTQEDTEDEGLDEDTEDDGLELIGLVTLGGDDPDAYLARFGAEGLAAVGRRVRGER